MTEKAAIHPPLSKLEVGVFSPIMIKRESDGSKESKNYYIWHQQGGGCSKTTSAGITAHLLSQDAKVLAVAIDIDGQGDRTHFLTGVDEICDIFEEKTILEAIKERNITKYIVPITDNLHIVPSNDYLVLFSRYVYTKATDENKTLSWPIRFLQ